MPPIADAGASDETARIPRGPDAQHGGNGKGAADAMNVRHIFLDAEQCVCRRRACGCVSLRAH